MRLRHSIAFRTVLFLLKENPPISKEQTFCFVYLQKKEKYNRMTSVGCTGYNQIINQLQDRSICSLIVGKAVKKYPFKKKFCRLCETFIHFFIGWLGIFFYSIILQSVSVRFKGIYKEKNALVV